MKKIKIFLASSRELNDERKAIAALANELNQVLEALDIMVLAVEWENLDSSMGVGPKQEEYNTKLRECEMCMVLFKEKFGKWTEQEFEVAYTELKMGNNPRKLYVYFKEGEDVNPSPELREFRDSLEEKYGHFYSTFTNLDSLKAEFLKQFMLYQSQILSDHKIIDVKDGKVMVGGKVYVNLQNISSFGNNNGYQQLRADILYLEKDIAYTAPEHPLYKEKIERLNELHKQLKDKEEALWDTTLTITKLSNEKCSERLKRAIDCFDKGDDHGAIAILKEDEIYNDAQQNIQLIKLGKANLKTNIDELNLKIDLLRSSLSDSKEVSKIYEQIANILTKVIEYSSFLYGEHSREVFKLYRRVRMLLHEQPKRTIPFLEKAIDVAKYIYSERSREVISIYEDIARVYKSQEDEQNYRHYLKLIIDLSSVTFGAQSEKYIKAIIELAEHLEDCRDTDSDIWYDKAISICEKANYTEWEKDILMQRLYRLIYNNNKDLQKIEFCIEKRKELSQKNELPKTYIEIAQNISHKMPKTAIKYYEQAIACASEQNIEINLKATYVALAHTYLQIDNIDKQIEYLNKALSVEYKKDDSSERRRVSFCRQQRFSHWDDWFVYHQLIETSERKGDSKAAIVYANKCLNLAYKNDNKTQIARTLVELANQHEKLSDFNSAEKYILDAIELLKQNDYFYTTSKLRHSYIRLAKLYIKSSQIEKASNIYHSLLDNPKLVSDFSDRCGVLEEMAWAYFVDGNSNKAEQCYWECVELCLAEQPDKNWARKCEIDSSNSRIAKAYYKLAWFYSRPHIKEYTKAQEALDKSYAFQKRTTLFLLGRDACQAVVYRGCGEYQKAIDIFNAEIKKRYYKKSDILTQTDVALTLLEWGKPTEALEVALKVVDGYPDFAFARQVLGRIYKELDEKEKAREELEASLALMEKEHSPSFAIREIKELLDTL